jgi:hypothetical protein
MSRILYARILTGLSLILIVVSCSPQAPQPETETPASTVGPTETETSIPTASPTAIATLVSIPTEFVPPAPSTPKFAPFCESPVVSTTPSQCQLPIAEQSTVFCTNKVPYNLILINEGATYEVLEDGFKCSDAGLKDDKQIVTCTGPMASSFELRVCDPACALPVFQTETTACPQDYKFDTLRNCCTQKLQPADQNCVLLKLETKKCVVDCSEFTEQTTCENHYYDFCEWNDDNDVCQARN